MGSRRRMPTEKPRYELVAGESARNAVRRFVVDGGTVPMCHPRDQDAVQEAIDLIGQEDGWDDERRGRLGTVLHEMIERRDTAAELRFQGSRGASSRHGRTAAFHR